MNKSYNIFLVSRVEMWLILFLNELTDFQFVKALTQILILNLLMYPVWPTAAALYDKMLNDLCGHPDTLPIKSRWRSSSAGGFSLSWVEQSSATCGYTVEWCLLGNAVPCTLEWVSVPKENNTLFLPAGNWICSLCNAKTFFPPLSTYLLSYILIFLGHFMAGCRYSFNIYECTENGHRLLEVKTGYSQELSECYC